MPGDVMMIEGDIQMYGQNTTKQTDLPIMAHDYGDYNNITFEEWLDEIIKVRMRMVKSYVDKGRIYMYIHPFFISSPLCKELS